LWGGENTVAACFATEDMLYYLPMIRSFQFRCRPTRAQTVALTDIVFKKQAIYNGALEERIDCYRKTGKGRSFYDQDADLKVIRKENPEYAAFLQRIPRLALKDLNLAFKAFFRRIKAGEKPGFPRFRSSFRDRQTLKLGEGVKWHKGKGKFAHIKFHGLPGKLRFKIHNPKFAGEDVTVKTTMLTRDHKGWWVTFQCELPDVPVRDVADSIGIDVGIEKFLATDEGETIPNPRALDKELKTLRRKQRALSRKKRGGGNRQRARKHVARLHARIRNSRKNFHCKTAAWLASKGKTIVVENLNIKGLSRGMLARQVNDVAWGYFLKRLENKAESAGLRVEKVDPKFTSQACSECGVMVRKSLATRVHRCVGCGLMLDRDHNAAINIKNKAVASLEGANFGVARSCPRNLSLALQ